MALTERLALIVSLDAQGAVRGLEKVGKAADRNLGKAEARIDRVAQRMQKAGAAMLAGAGLAAAGLYKAGQSAADLEQAVGGTEAVFKDASGIIDEYAKTAARSMGLAEKDFRTATTSIGGQLKGVGFDTDTAAKKAVELTQVAADLSATYGGTTAEAVAALGAAFRGEADPAERFNLRLNQNTVNAKAVALGLAESTSQVNAQAKAQATLALITEQSADAQGQFAREIGTASGAMAVANAEFEDAKASLGSAVAPVMADVAGKAADLAAGFSKVNEASGGLLSQLAAYSTVGLAAGGGLLYVGGKVVEMRRAFGGLSPKIGVAAAALGLFGVAATAVADRSARTTAAAQALRLEAERTGDSLELVARKTLVATLTESSRAREGLDLLGVGYEEVAAALEMSEPEFEAWRQGLIGQAQAQGVATGAVEAFTAPVIQARRALGEAATVTDEAAVANKALGIAGDGARGGVDGLTGSIEGQIPAADALTGRLQATADAVTALFDAGRGRVSAELSYSRAILDTNDALDGLVGSGGSAGGAVRDFTKDIESAQKAVDDAKESLVEAQQALEEARKPATKLDVEKGQIDIKQARIAAERASRSVKEAEQNLKEVRKDGTTGEIRDAELDLQSARLNAREAVFAIQDAEAELAKVRLKGTDQDEAVIDAQERVADAQEGVETAQERAIEVQKESTKATSAGAGSQRDFAKAMLDAKNAAVDEAEALAELKIKTREANGETVTAAEKATVFEEALRTVADRLEPGSPLREYLETYIRDLAKIRSEIRTKILVDAGGAFQSVQELLAYTDAIGAVGTPSQFSSLLEFKQRRLLELDGRADGGAVSAGTPYIVGERGPELFVPGASGTIIPNDAVGGGGGATVVNINVSGSDPTKVVEAVSRYIKSSGQPAWLRSA